IAAVSNPVKIRQGDTSTLSYLGDPGAFIYWMPATQPVSGYTVNASPQITQIYTVQISKGQCIETRTVLVEVYSDVCNPDVIFIPNTFTPNRDGINDVLLVRSNALQSIYFAVYNRWGERVFETRNLNSGWDGTINTSNAEQGVYGWYIEAECFNGRKTFKKGNVTLLR
ncbi:MAG: gliding motility-associated C-terminal domain-containing protein, partial [Bacteroidia bacterium]|nr:gliding motility-associated C-terminal domain-containing protein [Bacteroidia bacterium]